MFLIDSLVLRHKLDDSLCSEAVCEIACFRTVRGMQMCQREENEITPFEIIIRF